MFIISPPLTISAKVLNNWENDIANTDDY